MTITTTTTPPAEQPEPIPAPVEPPSAPAPEAPELPVNEATQPMDAVTADPSAQMTPIERFGSPMVVTAQPQPTIEDLQKRIAALERDLKKSENARASLIREVKRRHNQVEGLTVRRRRILLRAKAYRAEISKANHHTANLATIIAMQKGEIEAARKQAETPTVPTDWRLKLDTAQQRIDQMERDLRKAEDANTGGGLIYGHDAAYWYRAWSREHAINTGYKTAGDTEKFLAGVLTEKEAAQ